MPFSILIVSIIISVIAALVTLIFSIIFLATGKHRGGLIFGVGFIMSVILAVLSIIETVKKSSEKIKSFAEVMNNLSRKNNSNWDNYQEENYYAYIPAGTTDTIPSEFYSAYADSTYYIPLVYPYRFVCTDEKLSSGYLENFREKKQNDRVKEVRGITFFTLNDKMLLAKRSHVGEQHDTKAGDLERFDNSYILFDFETGECLIFPNEKEMEQEAENRGYWQEKFRKSFQNHYWKYADNEGC